MIKNSVSVYIDGINFTHYVISPVKWGIFRDERLDEFNLSLRFVPKEAFKPITPVQIHIKNTIKVGNTTETEEETKYFLVATDSAEELPVGSGKYSHELYLVECTKYAECIIVDTLTFRNSIGNDYASKTKEVPLITGGESLEQAPVTPDTYRNVVPVEPITIVSPNTIFPQAVSSIPLGQSYMFVVEVKDVYAQETLSYRKFIVSNYLGVIEYYEVIDEQDEEITQEVFEAPAYTLDGDEGIQYIVEYTISAVPTEAYTKKVTYSFVFANSYGATKNWTITSCVNRICDLAEPLRMGETPRFYLNSEQAQKYDKVLAPQFSMTKQTLRECLQYIGKTIHAEPRLTPQKVNGVWKYEITFDDFTLYDQEWVYPQKYVKSSLSYDGNNFATHIDSETENLVNTLSQKAGTITEPYENGVQSVRSETVYARITDENMIIATQYPIYVVKQLLCCGEFGDNGEYQEIDITPHIYESTEYDTRLSSYSRQFPFSKAYALRYVQGEKNITRLNFKDQDYTLFESFKHYAIVNILSYRTGRPQSHFEALFEKFLDSKNQTFAKLAFRIVYTPIYSSRISQTKPYISDFPYGAGMVYNQQANLVETEYYGENIKGVIARIGNVDKVRTYYFSRLEHIPKAGQRFDKDFYISAVAVELYPSLIKCTLSLTKDFNRLSGYIGVSSVKRYAEVSYNQVSERDTLWKEYILISHTPHASDSDAIIQSQFMIGVRNTFSGTSVYKPMTRVVADGYSQNYTPVGREVTLPLITSAFGNSISFSWQYKDNFSAGERAEYHQEDDLKGYWTNDVPYGDYYGRIYYYDFYATERGTQADEENYMDIGAGVPLADETTTYDVKPLSTIGTPILLRKDNSERLQANFQIDFCTDVQDLIIGSHLASGNPFVSPLTSRPQARLFVFEKPLNKFIKTIWTDFPDLDYDDGIAIKFPISTDNRRFAIGCDTPLPSGKSWAIITEPTTTTETVVDENGEEVTQEVRSGGDILIAQNIEITQGDMFKTVYFIAKRNVFEKNVWKDTL